MAISWTVDSRIVQSIRRRGMIPNTEEAFSDEDILFLANEELQAYVVPQLLGVREEYMVKTYDFNTTNESHYTLPPRAVGREIRNILWQSNASGNQDWFVPLMRIEPEREWEFGYVGNGGPYGYKFEGDQIVLIPTPASGTTIRIQYFIRPNQLTSEANARQISSVNYNTGEVTFSENIPLDWGMDLAYDCISNEPGFSLKAMDLVAQSSSTNSLTFDPSELPSNLATGDWFAFAQYSPIAQIPNELFPLLTERTCYRVLAALGDPRAQVQEANCERMLKDAQRLLSPRSQGSARVIVPRYAPGGAWKRGSWTRGGGFRF